jgi:uncharacterized protein (DUF433 family)
MKKLERIAIDPHICMGQPVIKGTRITVSTIVKMIAHGASVRDVVETYPELNDEDVKESLLFAAWSVSGESQQIA